MIKYLAQRPQHFKIQKHGTVKLELTYLQMLIIYIIIVTAAVSFAVTVIENTAKKRPTKGYNVGYIISAAIGSIVGIFISMGDAPWLMRLGPFSSPIVWAVMGAVVLSVILLVIRLRCLKIKTEAPTESKTE